jgi:phosphonoacetaldehyde hydrolase
MSEATTSAPRLLQAVVFDWAGTLVDFGSLAPMGAFVALFKSYGVEISVDEARVPMGLPKWHHIQALGLLPRIARAWEAAHGRPFSQKDVDALYEDFTPMSAQAAAEHAQCVPGALDTIRQLRERGLKIGSTTGYTRAIMARVEPVALAQGLRVDNLVCADDLVQGRPGPMGMYRCFLDLQVWPAACVVKVDDTVPGLMEGRHAGCWTVAVAASGNASGLSLEQWQDLSAAQRQQLLQRAHLTLDAAQPDFIVDSVADLPAVMTHIEALMRKGMGPRPVFSAGAAESPA